MADENVITYETFRKFQRQERDNENLQKLPDDFFQSCSEWIRRKDQAYQETKDSMVIKEIENVMSVIKDILDRRERKILLMTMHVVRSNAVPQNLHPAEEEYFDRVVENLKGMRAGMLDVIKGVGEKPASASREVAKEEEPEPVKENPAESDQKPEPASETSEKKEQAEEEPEPQKEEKTEPKEESKPKPETDQKPEPASETSEKKEQAEEEPEEKSLPKTRQEISVQDPPEGKSKIVEPEGRRLVRIVDDIPKFMGTDGKSYGPFKPDDMVTLETKITELLVGKGKAEFANI